MQHFRRPLLLLLLLLPIFWLDAPVRSQTVRGDSPLALQFSPPGGAYDEPISLTLTAPNEATIWYTLDGRTPTPTTATRYTEPFQLGSQPGVAVVRAIAFVDGDPLGDPITASYFLQLSAQLPLLSLVIDPTDFWGEAQGIYVNSGARGRAWERPSHLTFVEPDGRLGFTVAAGVRIHGGASRSAPKKSLRLYFRQIYGDGRLTYDLFASDPDEPFSRLVLHAGGQDLSSYAAEWTLLRNQLMANLAADTQAVTSRSRPVLLFINGESWGIYYLRERIDANFLQDHFGLVTADLLDTPEHVPGAPSSTGSPASENPAGIVAGDRLHWDAVMDFVANHDLSQPENYAFVQSQINQYNLLDYTILQLYAGNVDWPNSNVNQFRPRTVGGRWHWLLWDSDQTFGFPPDENGLMVDLTETALVEDSDPATTGRQTLLLNRLLANPGFRNRFLVRTADLLNSTLAETAVAQEIDSLAAALAADIIYETGRWPLPSAWQDGLDSLHRFAQERPGILRQQLVARFGLPGTAVLQLNLPNPAQGAVLVNSILQSENWSGIYFQDSTVTLTAVPAAGFQFTGWADGELAATRLWAVAANQTFTPIFEPAPASTPQPGDVQIVAYELANGRTAWDSVTLQVLADGLDLRGWRITDNDSPSHTDEGSLILPDIAQLTVVPTGTRIQLIATETAVAPAPIPEDDLNGSDGQMVLFSGNGRLDSQTDPWFNLGAQDNLVLLAPGNVGISFVSWGSVTAADFGILP